MTEKSENPSGSNPVDSIARIDISKIPLAPLPNPNSNEHQIRERKASIDEGLVAKYKLFATAVPGNPDIIYHPCSAEDMSPSAAFPDSRVIYVDLDEQAVKALQAAGQEAHHASAIEFDPGPINLLIMVNPFIDPDIPASHITENGYALVNDYHATASKLRKNPDFTLQAIIRQTKNGPVYDSNHPEEYWQEVATDEEFKARPGSMTTIDYRTAADIVETFTGKRDNILDELKKILAESKDFGGVTILNKNDKQYIVPTGLPRKKGYYDDLFVFQKISNPSPSIQPNS